MRHGKEIPRLEKEEEETKKSYQQSKKVKENLESELKKTPRFITLLNGNKPVTFFEMKCRDRINIVLLSLCLTLRPLQLMRKEACP